MKKIHNMYKFMISIPEATKDNVEKYQRRMDLPTRNAAIRMLLFEGLTKVGLSPAGAAINQEKVAAIMSAPKPVCVKCGSGAEAQCKCGRTWCHSCSESRAGEMDIKHCPMCSNW